MTFFFNFVSENTFLSFLYLQIIQIFWRSQLLPVPKEILNQRGKDVFQQLMSTKLYQLSLMLPDWVGVSQHLWDFCRIWKLSLTKKILGKWLRSIGPIYIHTYKIVAKYASCINYVHSTYFRRVSSMYYIPWEFLYIRKDHYCFQYLIELGWAQIRPENWTVSPHSLQMVAIYVCFYIWLHILSGLTRPIPRSI